MKNLIYIGLYLGLLFTSCSIFRHKTENRSSQKDLTVHAEEQRDSLRLTVQAQRIRFFSTDQLAITEIIPTGKFVYTPDSGFAGEARQVRVYRQNRQALVEKDTSALSLSGHSDRVRLDSTLHEQVWQQLEEQNEATPVSLWVYAVALLILLAINFGWRRG